MPADDETTQAILKTIQTSPQHTFSRNVLAYLSGTPDRRMRQAVAALREQGHLIVADEDGGYRLAKDANDVQRYTASLRSRIKALSKVIKAMETAAKHEFGAFQQLELSVDL